MQKGYFDIKITDPNKYIPVTIQQDTGTTKTLYILKTDIEFLKLGQLPEDVHSMVLGINYYTDTNGHYGGYGTKGFCFNVPEIVTILLSDKEFLQKVIKKKITWFLPKEYDIFLF